MRSIRLIAAGVIAVAWLVPAAFALPAGWLADANGDGVRIYRHADGAMRGELRVSPAEDSSATLATWFESKTAARMAGIAQSRFEPSEDFRPGMVMVTGEGTDSQGRPVALLRLGCKRTGGGLVYAESLLSNDRPYVRQTVGGIVSIFVEACMAGAAQTATAKAGGASTGGNALAEPTRPEGPPPFPYVKAAGTGLTPRDIEAILWEWRNEQSGMTMQVRTYYYLLLKDGTYRHGLPPVALEDFDATAAKQGERKEWGRWTRSGTHYGLQQNGSTDVNKVAADSARSPARKDEKLEGTWQIETAYSSLWSVSRSRRSISFDRDGRFSRDSGGSIVGSMGSQAGGNAVGGSVTHDDDSSSSSMSSPVAVAGSSRKRASTLPDRSGTYRLDGYTLELRYDSGRVERLSFCATGDRDNIYFQGEELRREKPGKR